MHLVETGGEDRRAVPAVEEEAAIMQVLMTLIFHHTLQYLHTILEKFKKVKISTHLCLHVK